MIDTLQRNRLHATTNRGGILLAAIAAIAALVAGPLAAGAAAQEVCEVDPETNECHGHDIGDGDGDVSLPSGFRDHALPILEKVANRRSGGGGVDCDTFVMPGDNVQAQAPAFITDPDRMLPGQRHGNGAPDMIRLRPKIETPTPGTFAKQIVFGC